MIILLFIFFCAIVIEYFHDKIEKIVFFHSFACSKGGRLEEIKRDFYFWGRVGKSKVDNHFQARVLNLCLVFGGRPPSIHPPFSFPKIRPLFILGWGGLSLTHIIRSKNALKPIRTTREFLKELSFGGKDIFEPLLYWVGYFIFVFFWQENLPKFRL